MYITSSTLVRLLQKWHPEAYGNDSVFYFSRILPPGQTSTKEEEEAPLLLLEEKDFLVFHENPAVSAAACIVAGNRETVMGVMEKKSPADVIIVLDPDVCLMQDVFPLLVRYYCEKNDVISRHKDRLLRLVSSGKSLQSVLQAATRFMENPFIVYDSHYALAAHSVPRTLAVPQAQNVVKNGYANVDVISQMEKDGSLDYVFAHQDHPCLVKIINGYEKLAVSIYTGNDYAGLLCFFNYVRPICEDDYELVQFLGQLTRIYFHSQIPQGSSWTPWDYLFSTVLRQKRSLTEDELSPLGLVFPDEMRLMAVAAPGALRSPQADQLKYLQTRMQRILPACHLYFHEGCLLCLDSGRNLSMYDSVHLPVFLNELEQLDMVCGISSPFYHISGLYTAFTQAEAALSLGQKQGLRKMRIFEYSQVTVEHMLSLLARENSLEQFCHPVFARLRQYDRQYRTNYLEFFLVYLLCGQSSRLCAECFDIHYNSVKYRLNVIQEMGAIDLKAENIRVLLYLSCRICLEKEPSLLDPHRDFFRRHPEITF